MGAEITEKQLWIELYSERICGLWQQWRTQLGVSQEYSEQLKNDLDGFYDDPLKKKLIETTY